MTKNENIYPGFRAINSHQPIQSKNSSSALRIPTSLKNSLEIYTTIASENDVNGVRSLMFKYIVPALGGVKPKGKRISDSEKDRALSLLEHTSFAKIKELQTLLEEEFKRQNVDLKKAKKSRCYLKKFIQWTEKEKWLEKEITNEETYYRFKETKKSRRYANDFELMPGRPSCKDRQKIDFDDLNETTRQELNNFQDFFKNKFGYRDKTIQRDIEFILRGFGNLYVNQGISLETLSLNQLVKYSPSPQSIRIKIFDNMEDYYTAFIKAQQEMKDIKNETLAFWENSFKQTQTTKQTQINYLKSLKNIGMFLYQNDTENFRIKGGYKDIPVIEGIRNLQNRLSIESKKEPSHRIPPEKRRISWDELLEVVNKFRIEFEQEYRYHVRHTRKREEGTAPIEKIKRTNLARAKDLMRFLILSFYTLIPPGRPRDFLELEIGKSFVQGFFEGGTFYPIDKMHDSQKAEWWIRLNPNDYKTGNKYGFWQIAIPNITYSNGKTFYEYIDLWLKYYRSIFNPEHDLLFTNMKGQKLSSLSLVKNAICRFTDVPVNPQNIRHIFVTYLRSIGATEEQLDSAAAAMRHSRKTQQRVYDLQDNQEKMQTILNYTQTTAQNYFNNQH